MSMFLKLNDQCEAPGPNGPRPNCAKAQMEQANGPSLQWARAQMGQDPNRPGPKLAQH